MTKTYRVALTKINKIVKTKTPEVDKVTYAHDGKHKYVAHVGNKNIPFGAIGYEDYLIHKDEERRKKYRARHKNDKINQIGPGRYSWFCLW